MKLYLFFISIFLSAISVPVYGQPTIGLLESGAGQQKGYVLFSPIASTTTYLIDKKGRKVNTWESKYTPGHSAYLLPDGSLLRSGVLNDQYFVGTGAGGIIEKFNWKGELT
ncbi:MAG: hypothetical protein IPM69_15275 [Ignavibacteria bacterium]|nr:hypothetical protein [Ignavibacteria bacterium]